LRARTHAKKQQPTMVHHCRQQSLPPLRMTLSEPHPNRRHLAPPTPAARSAPPSAMPTKPPRLARRSSSVGRIVTKLIGQVEMRYRNLREAFRALDEDGSGGLTREELQRALFLWRVQATGRHIDDIMADFDHDGNSEISYAEWCEGLKPFTVQAQPIFGLADRHVTNGHRVLPDRGGRVLLNDNLRPFHQQFAAPGRGARPDYELIELPRSSGPASPDVLHDHTNQLSNRIHDKFKKLKDAFRSFDENKDGKLSKQELMTAVRCFNLPIPREHVLQIAQLCDADADGLIDYNEFAAVLKRKDALGH